MLEKMGWAEGQGLGANNMGISEPVRYYFKYNIRIPHCSVLLGICVGSGCGTVSTVWTWNGGSTVYR